MTLFRIATPLAAGAARPFASEQALAQLSDVGRIPDDAVEMNANGPPGPERRDRDDPHNATVVRNLGRGVCGS